MATSEVAGPPPSSEDGIASLTLGALLGESARAHGDREAVVFHDPATGGVLRWSYTRLDEEADRVAMAVLGAGLGKGSRVALLVGNRPEWVASAFGVCRAGAVLVPVNTYLEEPELAYVLEHSDTAMLLMQDRLASHDYAATMERLLDQRFGGSFPYLEKLVTLGTGSWDEVMARGSLVGWQRVRACETRTSPFDDALIVYTSGTTAQPKGVVHRHRAACLQSWRFAQQLRLDEDVRVWSAFPFFWTAGFCMVMGATLAAGGCLVLQEHFEAGDALRLLDAERVTSAHAWPHQLAAMEDHPDWLRRDLSALRHVDPATCFARHPSARATPHWSPRAAYGLTETFTIVSSLPSDTPVAQRAESQGAVLPGNTVRIVDEQTGLRVERGVIGEITVKGTTMMRGYHKVAPEACFDADGFFHTGDAGYLDAAGLLHWTGRTSDMIKSGGANVSPVEIEEILVYHDRLVVALAIGVPHPTLGEMVVVCAVAHDRTQVTEADVKAFLRGKIASYKIPRRVLFFDEEQLTHTGSAKIKAEALRTLAAEQLGLSQPGGHDHASQAIVTPANPTTRATPSDPKV